MAEIYEKVDENTLKVTSSNTVSKERLLQDKQRLEIQRDAILAGIKRMDEKIALLGIGEIK